MEYLSITPVKSGYRNSKTLQMYINNEYEDHYLRYYLKLMSKYNESEVEKILMEYYRYLDSFTIAIPVNEICSLGFFDPDAYEDINFSDKKICSLSDPIKN